MNMLLGALASAFFGVAFTAPRGIDMVSFVISGLFLMLLKARI